VRYRLALLAIPIAIVALTVVPSAGAFVYWGNTGSTIGRANNDGSGVNQGFITGANQPCGIAVDASHLFWNNDADGTFGRANVDGSGVTQNLFSGGDNPCGIAVDASHIYWTNTRSSGSLGRANIDGSSPTQTLISPLTFPCGVAVDSQHIYWANRDAGTIGRANLDGGSPDPHFFNTGQTGICGVAVDGSHIYWADLDGTTIGRVNLNGSSPNPSFITGANKPCGVAVDANSVYWANSFVGTIGKANIDGTGANQSFVTGANVPCFVAVDSLAPPAPPLPPPPPLAITELKLSPSKFPAAQRGATFTRKHKRRRVTGTTVSYRDTQAATAHFTVLKRRLGVKSNGKCVPRPRHPRKGKSKPKLCFRFVTVGTFTHPDIGGLNTFHFTGRLNGRRLSAGRYRLDAVPVLGTRTGSGDSASFRISL
jgi:virginiamycin B lyase